MASVLGQFLAEKPDIPKLTPIDVEAEQLAAVKANKNVLPGAQELASGVNTFNYQQLQKMLSDTIPGFADIQKTASGNILSQLKGEIPQDVIDSVMRTSAWKSLRGGYGGGEGWSMGGAEAGRNILKTSYDISNQGLDSATQWITLAKNAMIPGQFDITSMFLSANEKIGYAYKEREQQFQRDYVANVNDAQYSMGSRAGRAADAVADAVVAIFSSYAGGMGGG